MPELELGPVWLSLQLATVTVIVLLVVATPLAWWLAFTGSRARTVVEAVVAMPLVLPPTVLGFYLLVLLGPAGFIGAPWLSITDTTLTFSFAGLVLASVIYSFPFTIQPLQAAFESVGRAPLEGGVQLRRRRGRPHPAPAAARHRLDEQREAQLGRRRDELLDLCGRRRRPEHR